MCVVACHVERGGLVGSFGWWGGGLGVVQPWLGVGPRFELWRTEKPFQSCEGSCVKALGGKEEKVENMNCVSVVIFGLRLRRTAPVGVFYWPVVVTNEYGTP